MLLHPPAFSFSLPLALFITMCPSSPPSLHAFLPHLHPPSLPPLCASVPGGGPKIPVLSPWHTYKCTAHTQTQLAAAQVFQGESRSPAPEERGMEGGEQPKKKKRRGGGVQHAEREREGCQGGGETEKGCCEVIFHHRVHFSLQSSPTLYIALFLFICPLLLPFPSLDPALSLFIFPFSSFFSLSLSPSLSPLHLSPFLSPSCLNSYHPLSVSLSLFQPSFSFMKYGWEQFWAR